MEKRGVCDGENVPPVEKRADDKIAEKQRPTTCGTDLASKMADAAKKPEKSEPG